MHKPVLSRDLICPRERLEPVAQDLERIARMPRKERGNHLVEHRVTAFILIDGLKSVRHTIDTHFTTEAILEAVPRHGVHRALTELFLAVTDLPRLEAVNWLERNATLGITVSPSACPVYAHGQLFGAIVCAADQLAAALEGGIAAGKTAKVRATSPSLGRSIRVSLVARSGLLQISTGSSRGFIKREKERCLLLALYLATKSDTRSTGRSLWEQVWPDEPYGSEPANEIPARLRTLKRRLLKTLESYLGPCRTGAWIQTQPGRGFYLNTLLVEWRLCLDTSRQRFGPKHVPLTNKASLDIDDDGDDGDGDEGDDSA